MVSARFSVHSGVDFRRKHGSAAHSLGDCTASHCASAHRHAMRVVLVVQLGWCRLIRARLAELGVLVALDQSGLLGARSTGAEAGRVFFHRPPMRAPPPRSVATYSITVCSCRHECSRVKSGPLSRTHIHVYSCCDPSIGHWGICVVISEGSVYEYPLITLIPRPWL